MDALSSIEDAFLALRGKGVLDRRFESWSRERAGLHGVADLDDLISLCRDSAPDPRKDAALAALCTQARTDQAAGIAICWLLLPGLCEAVRELPGRDLDSGELAAELLVGLWSAIGAVDEGAREVAGRLSNGARWGAQRAIRKAVAWNARVVVAGIRPPDRPFHEKFDEDLLARAVAEGVVTDEEIELLLARRPEVTQIARRAGVTVSVLKARKKRARERLARWVKRSSRESHPPEQRSQG